MVAFWLYRRKVDRWSGNFYQQAMAHPKQMPSTSRHVTDSRPFMASSPYYDNQVDYSLSTPFSRSGTR